METRANYALIGIFTLAVIATGFLFVYWFSGGDSGAKRQAVRVVFSGSVSGLSKGSVVTFNGIRKGEVTKLDLEETSRVVAEIEIDKATPIRTDTRARLELQGLTGVATIALAGGDTSAPPLQRGPGQPLPTIFADRSDFQDLMEAARTIARRADDVLERVGRLIADNEGPINRTITNVERFSLALSNNAPRVDRFLEQVGEAAEHIGPLAAKLEALTDDVQKVVRAIEPQRVARTVENIEGFTDTLAQNRENVSNTLRDVARLAGRLNESADKLDQTLTDIGTLVRAVDAGKINRSFDNIEGFTATLKDNRQNVDQILKDAATLTAGLNGTRAKADTALDDASKLFRSVDTGMVNRTLANLEGFSLTLAENRQNIDAILRDAAGIVRALDVAKINRTIDGAERFATTLGNSSPDVEKAISEARQLAEKLNKSADRIDGVLKAAEDFLGSAAGQEGKSMFHEVREAARSIRVLADNLDKRTADITAGINRFTGSGLREVETLTAEGRRTLNDVGRAVRSLERNPQQLIFGGKPNLPEYRGRP
ncbi:MAG TPA: MlaD family protein [Beijerinckiaceae bacterium]|jgi:phospholipid/cholesterol/gamma-HCH transport system substrate-binding protein